MRRDKGMTSISDRLGKSPWKSSGFAFKQGFQTTAIDNDRSEANDASGRHRIFLMQNHPLMILGTSSFLNRQPNLIVSGSATTPATAMSESLDADIVVLELSINGPYDFPFLTQLRRTFRSLPVLAFSYHEEVIFARRALEAGANGYLMKEAPPPQLAEAILQVVRGGVYMSDRVRARIDRENRAAVTGGEEHLNGSLVNSLTIKELRIFQCLGDEFSTTRIEQELGLTSKALESACYRMRKKLGLRTDHDLLQFATHWAYYEGDFS